MERCASRSTEQVYVTISSMTRNNCRVVPQETILVVGDKRENVVVVYPK